MANTLVGRKRIRKFFGKIKEVAEMPNLIEVQKASYDQFPDDGRAGRRTGRRRPADRFQVGLPDLRLLGDGPPRIREIHVRAAEIRCRRVSPAWHHLRGSAQGDAAPHRVRCGPRYRRQVRQGHQGAGRLHGRHAPDDGERHLHRQRHRACHRLPDAPFAGRVLRSRQGQDPFLGQAALCRAHHPLSRLVARCGVRCQGHRACAYRP